jgi:anti-anti-sigma regulatory factor
MLRIRRSENTGSPTFILSGRIERTHVPELQQLLDAEARVPGLTIDLEEVRLVDREAVRFLAACEARGIKLENCPSYVREWIERGSDTNHEPLC